MSIFRARNLRIALLLLLSFLLITILSNVQSLLAKETETGLIKNIEIKQEDDDTYTLDFTTGEAAISEVRLYERNKKEQLIHDENKDNYQEEHEYTFRNLTEGESYTVVINIQTEDTKKGKETVYFKATKNVEPIVFSVEAGTNTSGQIGVLATDEEDEPNDTRSDAQTIDPAVEYYGEIFPQYDEDWFRMRVWGNIEGKLNVYLGDVPDDEDYDVFIYDSDGDRIGEGIDGTGSNELVSIDDVEPGTYYAHVVGFSGDYNTEEYYIRWKFYPNYHWPVPGSNNISSDYGWRTIGGEEEFHDGLDITYLSGYSSRDYVIEAMYDGTVENDPAIKSGSCGWWVYIDHGYVDGDDIETKYCHMESEPLVEYGEDIFDGENLGYMGATGQVTGKHLHFEVIVDGDPVDPEDYISAPPDSVIDDYWE